MKSIITLTTDFGLCDGYVAAVKGTILAINPAVIIIDVCHTIKPQNIAEAAFVLSTIYRNFPKETIHLVIVDPGVGTKRRSVILRTPLADFVAPDNGVLSYILDDFKSKLIPGGMVTLKPNIEAVALIKSKYWLSPVSPTFHGRDIFAPVAAHLSMGTPLAGFGKMISTMAVIPSLRPHRTQNGTLMGNVIHIDNFGNLITSIKKQDLPPKIDNISIKVGGKSIHGLSRTYAERNGLLALIGSSGYVEISLKNGSAGDFLGVGTGDQVRIIESAGG